MMKSLFCTILMIVLGLTSHAQYTIGVSYGIDKIGIGKNHSVNWTAEDATSLKLSAAYKLKKFDIGCFALVGKYNLYRPNYGYSHQYSMFGMSLSKSLKIKDRLALNIQLAPYMRVFDTEFYSASLIIDSQNFGIGFGTDLRYKIGKKLILTCGYILEKDILRAAINSDEITNKDRFVNMLVNSMKIGVLYEIGSKFDKD